MRRRLTIIALGAVVLAALFFAPTALAHGTYPSTAAFLDAEILGPRGSVFTGDGLVDNWRWYGVAVLP